MDAGICSCGPPPVGWSVQRHTHPAVAQAIFALAHDERTPEAIWAGPTQDEWRKISELVVKYVGEGDFALDHGRFAWGPFETLRLLPTRRDDD